MKLYITRYSKQTAEYRTSLAFVVNAVDGKCCCDVIYDTLNYQSLILKVFFPSKGMALKYEDKRETS